MKFRRQDTRYRAEREKLGSTVMVDDTDGYTRALRPLDPLEAIDWGNDSAGAHNLARSLVAREFCESLSIGYAHVLHARRVQSLDRQQWQLTGSEIEQIIAEAILADPAHLHLLMPDDLADTTKRLQAYWPSGWLAQFARARLEAVSRNTSFRPLVRLMHDALERLGDPALDRIDRAAAHANGQEAMGSLSDFLEYHAEMLQVLTELTAPKDL